MKFSIDQPATCIHFTRFHYNFQKFSYSGLSFLPKLALISTMTVHSADSNGSNRIVIIIVGLGIAGLSAAIECHGKGHQVMVFEKYSDLKRTGK